MSDASEVDVEDFVIAYLTAQNVIGSGSVSARMPTVPRLPFALVQRVAGGDDFIVDHATIAVNTFDSDQTSASTIARNIHHAMRKISPKTVVTAFDGSTVNVYRCVTEQTPLFLEWEPTGGGTVLSRYVARYIIDIRLPAIPGF